MKFIYELLIKVSAMLGAGLSVGFMDEMGLFFLIPWILSWLLYDYASLGNPEVKG